MAALKTDIDSIDRLIQLLGEAKTREHVRMHEQTQHELERNDTKLKKYCFAIAFILQASTKLLGYGASILSFMGAIHWGAALVHPSLPGCSRAVSYSLSVVPSLLGWASLACLADAEDSTRRESTTRASLIQVTGFALLFCYDFIVVSKGRLPSWYISLRIPLTIGAVLSLLSPIMSTHDPLREIPNK